MYDLGLPTDVTPMDVPTETDREVTFRSCLFQTAAAIPTLTGCGPVRSPPFPDLQPMEVPLSVHVVS